MKSTATLINAFTSLSQNTSSTNQSLGLQLMNDQQRYLIEKYFDNERTFYTTTIGAQNLTTTASLASGATTATLTAVWAYATCTQLVNFSNSDQRAVTFTNNSTSITWAVGLSSAATTAITTVGVQSYAIPATVSKIINDTITIGQLRYRPAPIVTRAEWDLLNALPYTSDIPNYFYIYNGTVQFWPIPATTGNIITFNYKARVPDLTTTFVFSDTSGTAYSAGATTYDYQAGSLSSIVAGSDAITGSATSWNTTGKYPLSVDITQYNLYLVIPAPSGEGIYYPIQKFTSDTALTLLSPVQTAQSATTASHGYSIAQLPFLEEDFHDMLLHGALMVYFSSIRPNAEQYKAFKELYDTRLQMLEAYAGTKSINVDLGPQIVPKNPNLYQYSQS